MLKSIVYRLAPGPMNCNYCKGECIRKGFYKTTQRYKCKGCGRYQRQVYRNRNCRTFNERISVLNKEGVGISSISRILAIPKTSVQRQIERMRKDKPKPVFAESGQVYEVSCIRILAVKAIPVISYTRSTERRSR